MRYVSSFETARLINEGSVSVWHGDEQRRICRADALLVRCAASHELRLYGRS